MTSRFPPGPRPAIETQTIAPTVRPALLLVDDDVLIADALSFSLRRHFDVHCATNRQEALKLVETLAPAPVLALVDLGLPPVPHRPDEGFALIRELLARIPDARILVLSGQSDEAHARHARTLGAIDFVAKPCDPGVLLDRLQQAAAIEPAGRRAVAGGLIGQSPAIQKLRAQLAQYADSPFPVLVEGESGSGKEIVARDHLHGASVRSAKPFLALNCAAISPTLVEPTLFGHAKGAFTGATTARTGYFEDVADGTLFLDEIGELPLDLQAKLLRVLENGEFQRVGETQTRRSRARIVAATNRDLREEVRAGRFRNDLFHRLSVFTLSVPPLRDMGDDCILLLEHLRRHYTELTGTPPFALDAKAIESLRAYRFPGNVRELRNIVIRLNAKFPGRTIGPGELVEEFDLGATPGGSGGHWRFPTDAAAWDRVALAHLAQTHPFDLDTALRQIGRSFLDAALKLSHGNVSQAARQLGLSRTTFYSRLESRPPTQDE